MDKWLSICGCAGLFHLLPSMKNEAVDTPMHDN
jgi:hypothetical protein